MNKIVAYTAIFGGKDKLRDPKVVDKNIDYYLITDKPDLYNSSVYTIIKGESPFNDHCRNAKIPKIFPESLFSQYDISIWYDGKKRIIGSLNIIIKQLKDYDMIIYKHPHRNCLYDEAQVCSRIKKDDPKIIAEQIKKYSNEKFPKQYGLYDCGVLVRRHNLKNIKDLHKMWWEEISNFSRRDQISFPYVLEKSDINFIKFKKVEERKCFSTTPHLNTKLPSSKEKNTYVPCKDKEIKIPIQESKKKKRKHTKQKRHNKFKRL